MSEMEEREWRLRGGAVLPGTSGRSPIKSDNWSSAGCKPLELPLPKLPHTLPPATLPLLPPLRVRLLPDTTLAALLPRASVVRRRVGDGGVDVDMLANNDAASTMPLPWVPTDLRRTRSKGALLKPNPTSDTQQQRQRQQHDNNDNNDNKNTKVKRA